MATKYSFRQETCYCGADLSGLKEVATSNRFRNLPQAKCPECGRELLLDAPAVEPALAVSPGEEPVAAPKKARSSSRKKAVPEPEPEEVKPSELRRRALAEKPEPEAEPEHE